MLQPQVTSGTWHRWLMRSSIACGSLVAAIAVVQLASPSAAPPAPMPPAIVPMIIPAPTFVQLAAPPAPEPAAPESPPDPPTPPAPDTVLAPPPVHTACVADAAAIGVPFALAGTPADPDGSIKAVASPDACTLAAWTFHTLDVSWDGGQTWAHYTADEVDLQQVAVAEGRVVVTTNHAQIGMAHAGDAELTWHVLGSELAPNVVADTRVLAAGPWTVLAVPHDQTTVAAVSRDDGQTWSYFETPGDLIESVSPAGLATVSATRMDPRMDGESIYPNLSDRYIADLAHPTWKHVGHELGSPLAHGAWSYVEEQDEFWGCGGNEKVVARRGGTEIEIAGKLRPENWDVSHIVVLAHGDVAYTQLHGTIGRLAGARSKPMAEPPPDAVLVGIDRYDSALAVVGPRLLRWSSGGGWRVLFTFSTVPVEDETP